MKMLRYWNISVNFDQQSTVTRRVSAEELICGSHPRAQIKIPAPAPQILFTVARIEASDSVTESLPPTPLLSIVCTDPNVEIEVWGKFQHLSEFTCESMPRIRYRETLIEIVDISDQRKSMCFEPEKWAAEATTFVPNAFAIWHLRDGVLSETAVIEEAVPSTVLKSGYRVIYSAQNPHELKLVEYDGVPKNLELKIGRYGALCTRFDNNVFIITKLPDKQLLKDLNPAISLAEKDRFKQIVGATLATWLLFMSLLQFVPPSAVSEEAILENISGEVAKIILEAPRAVDGGNGIRGGGGIETTQANDKRGGSGFERDLMKSDAGAGEVVIKNKGALAALSKVEKVVGAGLMKALDATSKLSSALSSLDEGVKSGKVRVAGIAGFGVNSGKGSAQGVLGALGAIGGSGSGGGGVGIGGVGTKGLGGGGGGGSGNGFGTGVGSGLGKGEGLRSVAFDSDNVNVRGGLERSEVDAVIRENISQIRFCYNRGLRSNPSLAGKVTSNFTIDPNGGVRISRIAGSTLGTAEVEDCIKSRVASWRFPEPRGGGEVVVNYPFLFKSN